MPNTKPSGSKRKSKTSPANLKKQTKSEKLVNNKMDIDDLLLKDEPAVPAVNVKHEAGEKPDDAPLVDPLDNEKIEKPEDVPMENGLKEEEEEEEEELFEDDLMEEVNGPNKENQPDQPGQSDNDNEAGHSDNEAGNKPKKKVFKIKTAQYYFKVGYSNLRESKGQYYAKDFIGDEIYWKNSEGKTVYAWKNETVGDKIQKIEFPTVDAEGKIKHILDEGIPRYPKNLDTSDLIISKDPITGKLHYLKNEHGEAAYPRDDDGNEVYGKNLEGDDIVNEFNKYARKNNGDEIYPKSRYGDEFYIRKEVASNQEMEIGAWKQSEENGEKYEYYARNADGDEFYPRMFVRVFEEMSEE